MKKNLTNLDRAKFEHRLGIARQDAEFLIRRLGISSIPIDPVEIARTERKHLRLCGGNYGNAFDGRLEYHPSKQRFVCFYNTKYDRDDGRGHAPRTRFSLAHELGHYFIEDHHEYLRSGGKSHASRSEFVTSTPIEQQADCFAAHLLMPDPLVKPLVNQDELSVELISEVANAFNTSFVCAALRAAEVTHFCGAVVALRKNAIQWFRPSDALIEAGIYPGDRGSIRSAAAQAAWVQFLNNEPLEKSRSGWARDWFRIYDDDRFRSLPVDEFYLPVRSMETLIVVLSVPEDELFEYED